MIRGALIGAASLAASLTAIAKDGLIEVGQPFPLVRLPVVGQADGFDSLESYRGCKVMLHLFASW